MFFDETHDLGPDGDRWAKQVVLLVGRHNMHEAYWPGESCPVSL